MSESQKEEIKKIIANTLGGNFAKEGVDDDLKLVGNVLDSMAVTQVITALEENMGFMFDEEDLSAETFESVESLVSVVMGKLE